MCKNDNECINTYHRERKQEETIIKKTNILRLLNKLIYKLSFVNIYCFFFILDEKYIGLFQSNLKNLYII